MTIQAQLPDGRTLEFPDGTADDVIDRTVKSQLVTQQTATGLTGPPPPEAEPDPTLGSRILEATPQVGGGIVGGLAAAGAGAGMLPIVGAVALGAGAGEALKQIGQQLSGSLDAPKTSLEAAKRIAMAGVEEGTWEAVGGLAMKGAGKILDKFKPRLIEGADEVIDFFKDKIRPIVMPQEATESRALDLLGNVAESSIIGGSTISKFKNQRTKFFDDFADSLIDQFGERTDPADLGNLFVGIVEQKRKAHAEAAKVLYNNVSEALGNNPVMIPTSSLKDFAKHPRKISDELGGIEAKNAGDDLMAAIMDLPDEVSFEAMKDLRSRLISRVDEFQVINKKAPAIGKAKKMIQLADAAIESSLKKLGPTKAIKGGGVTRMTFPNYPINENPAVRYKGRIYEGKLGEPHFDIVNRLLPENVDFKSFSENDLGFIVEGQYVGRLKHMKEVKEGTNWELTEAGPLELWRIANQFYKEGQEKFNNVMIRRLIKLADDTGTGAEMIAPAIFKPGQISRVRKVRNVVDPQDWTKLQGFFVQHLLQKSTDVNGQIVGKRILNNIAGKPNSFGLPMMHEVLSPPQVRALQMFGKAAEMAQAQQSEGAGRVLIQLTQAGAMGAILTGNLELPAATVIFGPSLLSKMLVNPRIASLLTRGLSLPAHSPEAGGLLARLIAASHRVTEKESQ